jgi:hypothetical protein
MNPPRVRNLLNPWDQDMLETQNDDEDPHEQVEEMQSQMEEEQHLPFQTLSSSSMYSSSPESHNNLPP